MDICESNIAKTKIDDFKHSKRKTIIEKSGKCHKVPIMGKSVLLARQADVTIMQHVNDSEIISTMVMQKFRYVLDEYRKRGWKRRSKISKCLVREKENGSEEDLFENCATTVPEDFDKTLTCDKVPEFLEPDVITGNLQSGEKIDYDSQKFLHDALGDELNNYPTSASETDTYKSSRPIKRNYDDDYSIGTSDISTLLSKSNSSYSHFSRKLLRCNTYASSSMYDRDAYPEYTRRREDDCKAAEWMNEVTKQHQVIVQTSKALNLCLSCKQFKHSVEYVEAEKILLLAIERREAVMKELKLSEYEDVEEDCFCLGYIDISNITVPLIDHCTSNTFTFWLFAVVSCGAHVFATEVVEADAKVSISFKKSFQFNHLTSDFQIKVRLYALKVSNCNNISTINSEQETTACPTPNKLLGFYRNSGSKRVKQYHSYERRQPSFVLHGTVIIHIAQLRHSSFPLMTVPNYSPLEGSIKINISSSIEFSDSYSGFLTIGSEAGGLATWNRRWCRLSGYLLECWNYPLEQEFGDCICSIDLRYCVMSYISRADRELCARPRTLLVETGRISDCKDENTLMVFKKSSYTITRHYCLPIV
ncbi:hypothetical protein FQR65_LT06812 [Abscondita terminalis]|nr:hypothetical protein FQR65_LT06812 [Abscondita terminalis]